MVALHQAVKHIQTDEADVMLAGASEDLVNSSLRYHVFKRLGAYSSQGKVLPWGFDRDGFIMGEAAITLLLEEKKHALRRGAKIYAEVKSSVVTQDAHHILAPEASVQYLSQAYQEAWDRAHILPEDVDLILPHSTGTKINDQYQADAIRYQFPHNPYVASFTPQVGHPMSASGLLRVVTAALAIQNQLIPPTLVDYPLDSACEVKLAKQAVKTSVRNVACSAISYGGTNIGTIISRLEQ
jgi:3-oxoacyl-(acyl-carrier-protein) synthase